MVMSNMEYHDNGVIGLETSDEDDFVLYFNFWAYVTFPSAITPFSGLFLIRYTLSHDFSSNMKDQFRGMVDSYSDD